ncbi:GNAT family N-acetyltransferase [Facklamia sp. DSM 111018]|uniref:GNAT family N-acetyltransferase n=1 Tax=Facklamia lactis TaxID=2749967 RepID=A0ABS0LSZ5_9LACT|nr:GNAT family N-acetyltransferase [Facklamia lactis]MBG9987295.1 GNAT family N-acetyltransferase [Facklamia lactis]
MDNITVQKLSQLHAEEIANDWKYNGIYRFYDSTEDIEDYKELISSDERGDQYFEVLENGKLVGYFVIDELEFGVFNYGLGMKPDLTGQGRGNWFINTTLDYIIENYHVNKITLSVAIFNERAIKCYEKVGFIKDDEFDMKTNGSTFRFINMYKDIKSI